MSPAATLASLPPATLGPGGDFPSSALAQSMSYANTWLYGTVSLKPQCRPGMFMCSADQGNSAGPAPSFAILMCNCPEFLIGTTRSKKMLCKKCGGARTTNWNLDEFPNSLPGGPKNLSRRYNTVRINRPLSDFNTELDPYMLMRKSRFKNRSGSGDEKNDQLVSKNASRKSILECHVNPYDLIKFNKYYDTGQPSSGDGKREINTGCKINKILDSTGTVTTTSGGNRKITKLLSKFKFKSSSSAPVVSPNIRVAGHSINIHSGGEKVTNKISEEFVKDSSESEDLDEPEVDYSDVELDKNDLPAQNSQKKELHNEKLNRKCKRHNELGPVRRNERTDHAREQKFDYTTREKEYKSQSFNHYTDHNIFSQRKNSIQDTMKQPNIRHSVAKPNEPMPNELRSEKERRTINSSKFNDDKNCVSKSNSSHISNNAENDINNRLRNFTINEAVISRHYNNNKRHSFDAYRMSELQRMMVHGDSSQKRHSVSDVPSVAHLQNCSTDRQSRPNSNSNLTANAPVLSRSNSQVSTSSSQKSLQRGLDDGDNKIDLLETEIKPIPRISVKSSNVKSNTLTPVQPPRKSKSIDCTYRSSHHLSTDNQKPRAYSMDRTNSISELDLTRQKAEDIVVIRTNKNDTIKKYKETNQNKLNMSTFKYDTSDNSSRTGDNGSGRDYYEIDTQEDDDLDQNYILRNTNPVKEKDRNHTMSSAQQIQSRQNSQPQSRHSKTPQRRSSTASTHSADYQTFTFESRAKVNPRTSSLTSDQIMDIRAHFNTMRKTPNKTSTADNSKSSISTAVGSESRNENQTIPKEKSPQPDQMQQPPVQNDVQSQVTPKKSTNSVTDREETGSDFVYDFFIHRNNKFNSISSTTSTEIKSILKKKLDEDLIYNASMISSNDSTSGSSSLLTSSVNVVGDFSRGTRKKKQVQFESCTPEDEPLVPMIQKASKISFEDCLEVEGREEKEEEGEEQEEESGKDVEEKNEEMTETNDHPAPPVETTEDSASSNSPSKSRKFKLQRSESDRVPFKPGNDQSNSFTDTMRIKTMRKHYNKEIVDKLLLRPKEPPPPPPKAQTNTVKTSTQGAKGSEIITDKIPRAKIVNSHGGLLEDTYETVNTSGTPKTVHLKLVKTNPDYEGIKLFNKYELPVIPEEQKLSPVLNKKGTGPKFVVNDVQSALLKEINDKLKRMEKKREEKESNVYEDVAVDESRNEYGEKRPQDGTCKEKTKHDGGQSTENVEKSDKDMGKNELKSEWNTVEIGDHIYDSPEAEPYETIELTSNKNNSITKMDETKKEDENENKTEHKTSITRENYLPLKEEIISSTKKSAENKDVITAETQIGSIHYKKNLLEIGTNAKKDISKLPNSMGAFLPQETSTPIHFRSKSENNLVLKGLEDQASSPMRENTRRISVVSTVESSAITFAEVKNASEYLSPPPVKPFEEKVPSASSEVTVCPPQKSSGTSILINNANGLNKSSVTISNNKIQEPVESAPLLPKFHIGQNNMTAPNGIHVPSNPKVNRNVVTINITPELKQSSKETSFATIGESIYNGVHLSNNLMNNSNKNVANDEEEEIYHSSNILIKHDLSHTYDDFTSDDTMLDSLIEIPEHYKEELVVKDNRSLVGNIINKIVEHNVINKQIKENDKSFFGGTIKMDRKDNINAKKDTPGDMLSQINVGDKDAQIEEINRTFSSLIKDNYDPIKAVKDKLVPHICKNNRSSPDSVNNQNVVNSSTVNIGESVNVQENPVTDVQNVKTAESSKDSKTEEKPTDFTNFITLETKMDKLDVSASTDFNDTNSTSDYGSHYYMSSRIDTINEDIEKEEEEEDHYETIDGEPIYDEIPPPLPKSSPPPLPLTLPPNSLSPMSCNLKSIFEGASKSDIINYLVDAKQRFIDPSQRLSSASDIDSATRSDSEYNSDLEFDFRLASSGNHGNSDSSDCSIVVHEDSISLSSSSDITIRKEYVDIERNDSGVGSETSTSCRAKWQIHPVHSSHGQHECEDCDEPVHTQVTDSGIKFAPLICEKCTKMRAERREIILEIIETEEKYGRDLHIIIDEFYKPMLVAGLLTQDQLESIFLNTEELLDNSLLMSDKLREAFNEGDDEMMTAHVGRIFIESVTMLTAFQSYCTRQGTAALILANLEKEKELLRIFLRVSQMENSVLRRMNLNSFLMVPVQRVTKYPLLLARLYKVTPDHHTGKDLLIEAQHSIQLHLEHINSLARDLSTTKLWRKISMMNSRRIGYELEDTTYIKLRKLSVDVLDWNQDEVRFLLEEKLSYTQPTEHNWKRGRTVKLTPVNAVLVTLDKPATEPSTPEMDESSSNLQSPSLDLANSTTPSLAHSITPGLTNAPPSLSKLYPPSGVKEASLILLKEKNGRFALLREPLYLDKCIVYCDIDMDDYFELQEISTRDTFVFKADDPDRTKLWYRQLQCLVQGLGQWRKRRNALANIMMYSIQNRT